MNEYTTNQPIGNTNGNTPSHLNPPPQFSTGANPPAHQGSKWQTEIHDADKYNTPLINEPNKCEHQFVFSHKSIETVGAQAIYQTVIYVICPKCGLVKWQV